MFEDPGLEAVLRRGADALRRAPSYFRRVRREEARERRPAAERIVEVLGVVEVGELEVPAFCDVCSEPLSCPSRGVVLPVLRHADDV